MDVEFATSLVHKNDVAFVSGLLTGVNVMLMAYISSILAAQNISSSSNGGKGFVIVNSNSNQDDELKEILLLCFIFL